MSRGCLATEPLEQRIGVNRIVTVFHTCSSSALRRLAILCSPAGGSYWSSHSCLDRTVEIRPGFFFLGPLAAIRLTATAARDSHRFPLERPATSARRVHDPVPVRLDPHIYIYFYTHTLMVLQRSFGPPACVTKGEIHHGAPSKVVEGRFVCLEVWYYIKRSAPRHPGAFSRFNARRRMKIRRSWKAAAMKDDAPSAGRNGRLQTERRSSSPFIKTLRSPSHWSESVRLDGSFQWTCSKTDSFFVFLKFKF